MNVKQQVANLHTTEQRDTLATLTPGCVVSLTKDSTLRVHEWNSQWRLTSYARPLPAGSQVRVVSTYWMPPGDDCFPEVQVEPIVVPATLNASPAKVVYSIGVGTLNYLTTPLS